MWLLCLEGKWGWSGPGGGVGKVCNFTGEEKKLLFLASTATVAEWPLGWGKKQTGALLREEGKISRDGGGKGGYSLGITGELFKREETR